MGLYNILHGVNPIAPALKEILQLDIPGGWSSGRFRDIYVSEDGERIILYTRNGGGNRKCDSWWDYKDDPCEECPVFSREVCPVLANTELVKHPHYIRDYDDDFDETYAYFEFSVPEPYKDAMKLLAERQGRPKTVKEKTEEIIAEMESMTREDLERDPRFAPLAKVLKRIVEVVDK